MKKIVLFGAAALFGLLLAGSYFRGKVPPLALSAVHGLFAASGLVVLILLVMRSASAGKGGYALALLVVAALGGFYLVSRHIRKREVPNGIIIVHALAAVTGFVILLLWVLNGV